MKVFHIYACEMNDEQEHLEHDEYQLEDADIKTIFLPETSLQPKKSRKKKQKDHEEKDQEEEDVYIQEIEEPAKERKKRAITQLKKWETMQLYLSRDEQYNILLEIQKKSLKRESIWMLQEINKKIHGYKCQDIEKNLYSPNEFVDTSYVVRLLVMSNLKCYYCNEDMFVLYEEVRNPKQWSLERIDNHYGHNKENVEISCLSCNLKRKTMYHERFLFTKRLGNIVKVDG